MNLIMSSKFKNNKIDTDDDFNKNKCLNYDIVISDKPNDMPNLYPIDNLDDLGENLISILNSHYLIKK